VFTDGVIVDVSRLQGVIDADLEANTATVWAGTTIRQLGPELWSRGLALKNQGGIDAQTIGGAVGTATHGSGRRFTSLSGAIHSLEYVRADGSICRVDDESAEFDAFRTAVGTLGVFTKIGLRLSPAYHLQRTHQYWPLEEVVQRWEHETSHRRHFAFYYGAVEGFQVAAPPAGLADACFVQTYDEVTPDVEAEPLRDSSVAPSYQTFAWFDENGMKFHEMEYFVPFADAMPAVLQVREIMRRHGRLNFPLEVRTAHGESGWLSPMHGGERVALSVSALPDSDYMPYFRDVHAALREFDARPHWGKLHDLFDRNDFATTYPRFEDFVGLRRQLDPTGTFLNRHLERLMS